MTDIKKDTVQEVVKFFQICAAGDQLYALDSNGKVWRRIGFEDTEFVKWHMIDPPMVEVLAKDSNAHAVLRVDGMQAELDRYVKENHKLSSEAHQHMDKCNQMEKLSHSLLKENAELKTTLDQMRGRK